MTKSGLGAVRVWARCWTTEAALGAPAESIIIAAEHGVAWSIVMWYSNQAGFRTHCAVLDSVYLRNIFQIMKCLKEYQVVHKQNHYFWPLGLLDC